MSSAGSATALLATPPPTSEQFPNHIWIVVLSNFFGSGLWGIIRLQHDLAQMIAKSLIALASSKMVNEKLTLEKGRG